jgi:hypothetical protein
MRRRKQQALIRGFQVSHEANVFLALLVTACSGTHAQMSGAPQLVTTVQGTLLYPNNQLEIVGTPDDTVAFISSTVGLSSVELIKSAPQGFTAVQLEAPAIENTECTVRSPVALSVTTVDADKTDDVLISDPCGNWVGLGSVSGEFKPTSWSDLMPQIPAYPFLSSFHSAAANFIFAGTGAGAQQLEGVDGMWTDTSAIELPLPALASQVTQLMLEPMEIVSGDLHESIVMQGYQRLVAVPFDPAKGADAVGETLLTQTTQDGYLQPFDAFDDLASLQLPECGAAALGIGLVSSFGQRFPRRLERMSIHADSFDTLDVPTGFDSVVTFSVLPGPVAGGSLVFMLGKKNGVDFAAAWQFDCDNMTELTEFPVEFDWKTPPAPSFGPAGIPKTDGVKLISRRFADEFDFIHYDGYDVRLFRVANTGGWTGSEEKYNVHKSRDDLIFGSSSK